MSDVEDLKSRSERLATSSRISELDRLFGTLEHDLENAESRLFSALAMLVTDAILDWDEAALEFASGQLQRLASLRSDQERLPATRRTEGRLLSLIDIVYWGIQRALPMDLLSQFEPDSHAHRFLVEIKRGSRMSNTALARELEVEESEVSRVGRRLVQAGLARKQKLGRTNMWLITPRGVQVVGVLDAGGVARPTREHRQLQT